MVLVLVVVVVVDVVCLLDKHFFWGGARLLAEIICGGVDKDVDDVDGLLADTLFIFSSYWLLNWKLVVLVSLEFFFAVEILI